MTKNTGLKGKKVLSFTHKSLYLNVVSKHKQYMARGAAVAQWIRLSSAAPGSNPKQPIYAFINLNLNLNCDMLKKTKINRKRGRDWPKNSTRHAHLVIIIGFI